MAKIQHTVTGCVPIDRSVIEAYSALVNTNVYANIQEDDRQKEEGQGSYSDPSLYPNTRRAKEADRQANELGRQATEGTPSDERGANTRWGAEKQRQYQENIRQQQEGDPETSTAGDGSRWGNYKQAEAERDAISAEDHRVAVADHETAGDDHITAVADHGTVGDDHLASTAATARANDAAAAAEHMVDIHRGPKGEQGNTGASIDYPYELVNNLTTDDATKGLSAAMGKVLGDEMEKLQSAFEFVDITYRAALSNTGGIVADPNNGLFGQPYAGATDYNYSNYIDIEGFKKIRITAVHKTAASSTIGLCFYSSNSAASVISGVIYRGSASDSGAVEEIAIPESAKFIRTSYWKDTTTYGAFSLSAIAEQVLLSEDVVNSLISTETKKPLSAAKGKELQDTKASAVLVYQKTAYDENFGLTQGIVGQAANNRVSTGILNCLNGSLRVLCKTGCYIRFAYQYDANLTNGTQLQVQAADYTMATGYYYRLVFAKDAAGTDNITPADIIGKFSIGKQITIDALAASVEKNTTDITEIKGKFANQILCIGDSLTVGTGRADTTNKAAVITALAALGVDTTRLATEETNYPVTVQEILGAEYDVKNTGVGGENVNTIMARQGAASIILPKSFVLPQTAGTTVAIADSVDALTSSFDGSKVTPLLQYPVNTIAGWMVNPCYVQGIKCTMSRADSTYYLTRVDNGSRDVTIPAGEQLICAGITYRNPLAAIIFVGTNGGFSTNADYVAKVKAMIENMSAKTFIVVGMHTGTKSSMQSLEQLLVKEFSNEFFNWREYVSTNALYDFGISPTQEDLNAMTVGSIPPSLLYDSIHLNAAGYLILGYKLSEMLKRLL